MIKSNITTEIEPYLPVIKSNALGAFENARSLEELDAARVNYLGSNGKFTAVLKQLGTLPKEEKPAAGKLINLAKQELEAAIDFRSAPHVGPP